VGFLPPNSLESMQRVWCIFMGGIFLAICSASAQIEDTADAYPRPYPTRNEGPSVQFGQAYQDISPNMPRPYDGAVLVKPKVETPDGVDAAKEAVITAEIAGLVFLENADQVKKDGAPGLAGVVTGIGILNQTEFQDKMRPYFGRPATMSVLDKICRDVIDYYRQQGFPVVNVVVPQQTVRDGAIQFLVTEARVGKVIVEGARWFNPDRLRENVTLREGDRVDADELQEDVRWLNNNPFRQANLAFQPGEQPGTTDVILEVNDRMPLRFFFTYDNYGIDLTGKNRLSTGFNFGNLFSTDQQVNFQYTTTTQEVFNSLKAYSGSWIIPFPWRNYLTIFGSYSGAQGDIPGTSATLQSASWQVSARYNAPLPMIGVYSHEVYGGFDFKQASNSLLIFNITTPDGGGFGTYDIFQLTAGYSGSAPDEIGSTSFELGGFYSPGGVGTLNNSTTFNNIISGANPEYGYGRFSLTRGFILPLNFSIRGEFNGQLATTSLMPTEQFGLGGYNTVRGYDERVANGDNAWVMNLEFWTPPGSVFKIFGNQEVEDRLQFLAFWDYGSVGFADPLPGQVQYWLMSVGPGLRYNIDRYVNVQFDWGFQLHQAPPGTKVGNRAELSATIAY
jgi:hemolysin activation/secretion protein